MHFGARDMSQDNPSNDPTSSAVLAIHNWYPYRITYGPNFMIDCEKTGSYSVNNFTAKPAVSGSSYGQYMMPYSASNPTQTE